MNTPSIIPPPKSALFDRRGPLCSVTEVRSTGLCLRFWAWRVTMGETCPVLHEGGSVVSRASIGKRVAHAHAHEVGELVGGQTQGACSPDEGPQCGLKPPEGAHRVVGPACVGGGRERSTSHNRPGAPPGLHHAGVFEFPVGTRHRPGSNAQLPGQRPHGWKPVAQAEVPRCDQGRDLGADLFVGRHC